MSDIRYEKNDKVYLVKKRKESEKKVSFLFIFLSMLFILFGVFYIMSSLSLNGTGEKIFCDESGNIDYKVYLKDNDYYEEKFLGSDMQYIASLINTINIRFNYEMHATEKMHFDYKYKIIGTLKITDKIDKNKVLYKKEYVLKEETNKSLETNSFRITEDIDIDYDKYNSYADAFRRDYSLSSNAFLELKMLISIDGEYKALEDKINKKGTLEMSIPLSEQTIDIAMNASKIENNDVLSEEEGFKIYDRILLLEGIVLLIVGLFSFIVGVYIFISRSSSNPYEKALYKILKNYDTYIVKAKSDFIESGSLVRVTSFEELIDAQQIEKTPILFYEVIPGEKSYFVLNGTKVTYRFTLTKAYQIKLMQEHKRGEF